MKKKLIRLHTIRPEQNGPGLWGCNQNQPPDKSKLNLSYVNIYPSQHWVYRACTDRTVHLIRQHYHKG